MDNSNTSIQFSDHNGNNNPQVDHTQGVVHTQFYSWDALAEEAMIEIGFFGSFILSGLCRVPMETLRECKNPILETRIGKIIMTFNEEMKLKFSRVLIDFRIGKKLDLLKKGYGLGLPDEWVFGDFDIKFTKVVNPFIVP